jgi:hypothetical protein
VIKIKKEIDFPDASYERSSAGPDPKWPLGDLEVGDGFEAPVDKTNAIRCSIQHFQRWYPGKKFKTKKVGKKILVKRTS